MKFYYVLFDSHNDGLEYEKTLKMRGFKYDIVPTPRYLRKSCGISIRIKCEIISGEELKVGRISGIYIVNSTTKEVEEYYN